MSPRRPNRGVTLGIASGGLLLGHWLAYLIVSPVATARDSLLASTGHAYLGAADRLGLGLALAALASVFLARISRPDETPRPMSVTTRLAAFQVFGFVLMEITERLVAGASVAPLLHGPVLPAGIAVQVAVAALCALAVLALCRAADLAEAALATSPMLPRPASAGLVLRQSLRPLLVAVPTTGARDPPSPR